VVRVTSLGSVVEAWSYPLSSVGGERVDTVDVTPAGVMGDRRYALIDAGSGVPAAPEREPRWRRALLLRAIQVAGSSPLLHFPDGHAAPVTDPTLNARLSDYFGFGVTVATHDADEGDPAFPLARHRHRHFPVHLLTTASMTQLAALHNTGPLDSRRFRPTFLIETRVTGGFVEDGWIGQRLRLGDVGLTAQEQTRRCGVTLLAQPGLEEDPDILRGILRYNKRNLGLYCSIHRGGTVRPGDELVMEG
jgi:uncharacterized protein